jgi:hypothetical protein
VLLDVQVEEARLVHEKCELVLGSLRSLVNSTQLQSTICQAKLAATMSTLKAIRAEIEILRGQGLEDTAADLCVLAQNMENSVEAQQEAASAARGATETAVTNVIAADGELRSAASCLRHRRWLLVALRAAAEFAGFVHAQRECAEVAAQQAVALEGDVVKIKKQMAQVHTCVRVRFSILPVACIHADNQ